MLFAAVTAPAQDPANENDPVVADTNAPAFPKLSGTGLNRGGSAPMPEDKLAALTSEEINPQNGSLLVLTVFFERKPLSQDSDKSEISRYARSGKVPYRVGAKLDEIAGDRTRRIVEDAVRCHFYVQDSAGKVLVSQAKPIALMCSAVMEQVGGCCGDAAKAGEYTAVVWVEYAGVTVGRKVTVQLEAFPRDKESKGLRKP